MTWLGVDEDFEGWYRREHPRVLASCMALSGDADVACDATDEAFTRAMMRWPAVSSMDSPGAWVHTVALNCLRRSLRRARTERVLHPRPTPVTDGPVVDPGLWAAVRALPRRQRTAIVLRYVADLSEPQVAEAMGIRRGTVAATLSQARKRLAHLLGEAPTDMNKEVQHD